MTRQVKAPIFFIGFPRSGTTIIFESFSVHEDLSWFSNWLRKYPELPALALLSRITLFNVLRGAKKQLAEQSRLKNYLPFPDESYPLWENCCGRKFLYDYLINRTADYREKHKSINLISKVMYFHGKERFAAKLTGPSRIHYLNSIFPDSIFIHIIRDSRAVVNSLMNVSFWRESDGFKRPWWNNGLTSGDFEIYERHNKSALALAALQWRRVVKVARKEALKISDNRYYEVKYEEFIDKPHEYMKKLFEFSGLKDSIKVHSYIDKFSQLKSQNYKYMSSIKKEDLEMLKEITGDLLLESGYQI